MAMLSVAQIEELSATAMRAHGAREDVAAEMARAIAWAEARQNRICGLYYLESYCLQLRSGRVDGQVAPQVSRPRAAEVRVDAGHGFAQVAFRAGLDTALAAAEENGVASLALYNAHTCTALGYFSQAIAERGCLALGLTNASPIVAPPGGKTRVIGTNPIAFAVPDGAGGVAMMFDQSTTTVALGRITMAKAAGEAIPEGWALDPEGQPTTDPAVAVTGSMTSAGGYKGWGFGLMAEILAACLGGGVLSTEVGALKTPEGKPHDLGQYFVLIHPREAGFYARMQHLAELVARDEGCRMPGQGKTPVAEVEVPDTMVAQLQALAGAG